MLQKLHWACCQVLQPRSCSGPISSGTGQGAVPSQVAAAQNPGGSTRSRTSSSGLSAGSGMEQPQNSAGAAPFQTQHRVQSCWYETCYSWWQSNPERDWWQLLNSPGLHTGPAGLLAAWKKVASHFCQALLTSEQARQASSEVVMLLNQSVIPDMISPEVLQHHFQSRKMAPGTPCQPDKGTNHPSYDTESPCLGL